MGSLNKVHLIGNLGQDPRVAKTSSGGSVASISLATSIHYTDKPTGEKKVQTEWHRVVFFNRLAEVAAEYLVKGMSVYVEGRMRTRKWVDDKGIERYTTEVLAESLQMLGSKQDAKSWADSLAQDVPEAAIPADEPAPTSDETF